MLLIYFATGVLIASAMNVSSRVRSLEERQRADDKMFEDSLKTLEELKDVNS